MTEIERKALDLLDEITEERGNTSLFEIYRSEDEHEAICRAIEQHEAFRQQVSNEMVEYSKFCKFTGAQFPLLLERFIIPKPDPLVEVLADTFGARLIDAAEFRAALEARGLEIREKSHDD